MSDKRMTVMIPVDGNTVLEGAREVKSFFSAEISRNGLADEINVLETGSFGPSDLGVLAAVQPDGVVYADVTREKIPEIVSEHFLKGRICAKYLLPGKQVVIPAVSSNMLDETLYEGRIVLKNCGSIDPESIDEYIANDGYFALGKALEDTPENILEKVTESGLRGRGGAGFPTGVKWGFCAGVDAEQKYVICNADEGEPGTFKDRLIMEGDPHSVLEGMALCAYAIGASLGYIYIRGEYKLSIERIKKAIDDARRYGFLGENIFETGFNFDVKVKIGAGAYVCGEETALIESMEGKRGLPRLKPPFPAQAGFKGKPTNVNNVETLANVPPIVLNGPEWFKKFGTEKTPGTKVYTIIGHVNKPGLIEVSAGVTLREIIDEYSGGMKGGNFKFAQLGGTAGDILGAEVLDVPMDYDSMQKVGHVLGSGAILVLNEKADINDFLNCCMKFFVHESCGNCNPCRNGNVQLKKATERLMNNQGLEDDLETLEEVSMMMKLSSFCPLGQSPAGVIHSALRYFRDEMAVGINSNAEKNKKRTNREFSVLEAI